MNVSQSFRVRLERYASKARRLSSSRDYQSAIKTIELLSLVEDPFGRDPSFGHVTASAWILNKEMNSIILTHHKKLDLWLQVGGHCDGHPYPEEAAFREAIEETGLSSIRQYSPDPIDIDIHLVPENAKEPAHYHYDIRYLMFADDTELIKVTDESHDVKWINFKDIEEYTKLESVLVARDKTTNIQINHANW